jgi:hypothetical protein
MLASMIYGLVYLAMSDHTTAQEVERQFLSTPCRVFDVQVGTGISILSSTSALLCQSSCYDCPVFDFIKKYQIVEIRLRIFQLKYQTQHT